MRVVAGKSRQTTTVTSFVAHRKLLRQLVAVTSEHGLQEKHMKSRQHRNRTWF